MSIYTSEIVKPLTQIFNQQPKDTLEIIYDDMNLKLLKSDNYDSNKSNKSLKKPVAYILPIESSSNKDQAIQTDSISIDINSIIDIQDFQRSERLVGKLEHNSTKSNDNDYVDFAKNRIKLLENALQQQLKNNEDIKKLLIASLGEDLAAHFIKLTSDVASFNEKVDELLSERIESNESIDKLSIEADLWKNKFVAGRVLVDELAGWKHQLALRYNESLSAVHNLLQERQRLRHVLSMISKELLEISAHLNYRPKVNTLSNTLHLANYNLDILRAIKNNLSKGAVWNSQLSIGAECLLHFTDFTEGEELAIEVLRNQPNPYADNTARITTSFVSEQSQCMERIADKICKNCKGDIFVI